LSFKFGLMTSQPGDATATICAGWSYDENVYNTRVHGLVFRFVTTLWFQSRIKKLTLRHGNRHWWAITDSFAVVRLLRISSEASWLYTPCSALPRFSDCGGHMPGFPRIYETCVPIPVRRIFASNEWHSKATAEHLSEPFWNWERD
jgi:hypothetical protein